MPGVTPQYAAENKQSGLRVPCALSRTTAWVELGGMVAYFSVVMQPMIAKSANPNARPHSQAKMTGTHETESL